MRQLSVLALFFCLLLAAKESSGQNVMKVSVRDIVMVSIEPPRLKARLKPIDEEMRVALYLPSLQYPAVFFVNFDKPTTSRGWYAYDEVRVVPPSETTTNANEYLIASDQPLINRITEIVKRLFPRTTIYQAGDPPGDEPIQLHLQVTSGFVKGESEGTLMKAMRIQIELAVIDAKGHQIAIIKTSSSPEAKPSRDWSTKGAWTRIATRALSEAFDGLIKAFPQTMKLHLDQKRALPAGLMTTALFNDESSLLPNRKLDAGDKGTLLIQVSNKGPGPAYEVDVRATSDRSQITLSGDGNIGDLMPGQSKEVALRIAGSLDLTSTVAKLRIETAEKRGYGAQPVVFELPTGRLLPPQLEIVDIALNDRASGRTLGDGDGQPANGETLEAIVRVRNAGPGEAVGVMILMESSKAIAELLEAKTVIPRIAVDQVEEARLHFRLPIALQASELPLSFHAVEARGVQVGSANKKQTWKIRSKRPGVELLTSRLFDGSSTGSLGNRDGLVNNGERIEVAVTLTNRGDLPARGLRIAIDSADPKLVPRPAVLEIGDLPANAEGDVQRFVFEVPRTYGIDQSAGDLRFTLSISQQSFPPSREPLTLTFRGLRPQLLLETMAPPALPRGATGELVLRLQNSGTLPAEDVSVEVTSDAIGVDLLDERGLPVRTRKIKIGSLAPQGVMPEQRLRVSVRRSAAVGTAPLRIAISQRDFSPLHRETGLAVTEEPVAVIAAAPTGERAPESLSSLPPSAPATISFLRNTPGEHLLAEAIVLHFEVQAPTDLAEIRLTQNERLLPIDAAQRRTSTAGRLQVAQYEVPVRLEEGENHFEVVAVTRQGLRSARPLTLIRDREVGRIWVVAIGISKYQDTTIRSLQYADADARAIYSYFRDTFGLPEDQIFLRMNEQATLREIKRVLGTQLATQANDPRDTVVLYFAGHGMRERVKWSADSDGFSKYFLPYDTDRHDLYSTALDMDEVTTILRRLVPERVVVLLDSCFSGAAGGRSPFDPKTEGGRALITGEFLDRMAQVGKGRVVLTAGGPDESAQESGDFGHGVFTYYLLDGLRGAADLSGDGEIDVHEVYRYVSDKVTHATEGRQNPELKEPDLVGRILLGRGAARRQ